MSTVPSLFLVFYHGPLDSLFLWYGSSIEDRIHVYDIPNHGYGNKKKIEF